jgi:hypothetical protein
MARWQDFERLAELIFNELHPWATVVWNDHIPGRLTQIERQIDVSIRWVVEQDSYLCIVQTKDIGAPADVNIVGEFIAVTQDVGAHSGVLVCRSGFTEAARTYARNTGIALYNLHDAQSANWSLHATVPILWQELTPTVGIRCEVSLEAGDTFRTDDPLGLYLTTTDQNRRINPISTFQRYWNSPGANRTPGTQLALLSSEPLSAVVKDQLGTIRLRPVRHFSTNYAVDVESWLGRFQPDDCRGLIDYLDAGAFTASYLPLSQIPIRRDPKWERVDPDILAVSTRGTIVTTTQIRLITDGSVDDLDVVYVGPE